MIFDATLIRGTDTLAIFIDTSTSAFSLALQGNCVTSITLVNIIMDSDVNVDATCHSYPVRGIFTSTSSTIDIFIIFPVLKLTHQSRLRQSS